MTINENTVVSILSQQRGISDMSIERKNKEKINVSQSSLSSEAFLIRIAKEMQEKDEDWCLNPLLVARHF